MSKQTRYFSVPGITLQQMREALEAARPYVVCCTEPDNSDLASTALIKLDDALALRFVED